jgi:hypothetical protein
MGLPSRNAVARPLLAAVLALTCLPVPAALAQTSTVTDINIESEGGFALTVPSIETTGASIGETELRAIFSGNFADAANELSDLDAESIRIPEIRLRYDLPAEDGTIRQTEVTYRDLELLDVADGVAGTASVGGAEVDAGDGVTFSFDTMSAKALNIGGALGFYGLGAPAASDEFKPIYTDFVFEGMRIASKDFNCDVGTATVAEFSARPLRGSFQDTVALIQQMEAQEKAGDKPSPEAIAGLVAYYVDVLTAFRSAPTEFEGFTCSGSQDGKAMEIRGGAVTVGGFEPGTYPQIGLDDFRLEVENDGWMAFSNFTWKAMDFNAALTAVTDAGAALDEAWFTANWRQLVPAIEGFSLAGFDMDIPDPDSAGQRIQASIGAFDINLAEYVNGIPSLLGLTATGIKVALPPDAGGGELAALGLGDVELDYELAMHWDQPNGTILVDRFDLSSAGMGSVHLSGTIGNAVADLFSEDIGKAAAAAEALTFKDLRLEIVDEGILSLAIALAAREENQEPAAFRAVLSGLAQAMPLALLGANPETVGVGTALRGFVDGQPNLLLTVTAKDPAGIGLAEFEAFEKDPTAIAGKVSIAAEASGEPRPAVYPALPAEPEPEAATDGGRTEKQGAKQ